MANGEDEFTVEKQLDEQGRLNFNRDFGIANAGRVANVRVDLASPESQFQGSRKHVLSLLDSSKRCHILNQIIGIVDVTVTDDLCPVPQGRLSYSETDLDTYLRNYGKQIWPTAINSLNNGKWWTPHGGTRPQMDLICRAKIGNNNGLLFVEAKAHEGELDWGGKPLKDDAKEESIQNHQNIEDQIRLANQQLNAIFGPGFNLSITSHYQLVNRLVYMWKLASVGVPVVLMYLGFTGDEYFSRDLLRDDRHWQRVMGGYMQNIVPQAFPELRRSVQDKATCEMIIRSYPVSELHRR